MADKTRNLERVAGWGAFVAFLGLAPVIDGGTRLWRGLFPGTRNITGDVGENDRAWLGDLAGTISIPAPTVADRAWAQQYKDAPSHRISEALTQAIEEHANWRVLYLINRPEKFGNGLLDPHGRRGFAGNREHEAWEAAFEHDNATAAYLLLKLNKAEAAKEVLNEKNMVNLALQHQVLTATYVQTSALPVVAREEHYILDGFVVATSEEEARALLKRNPGLLQTVAERMEARKAADFACGSAHWLARAVEAQSDGCVRLLARAAYSVDIAPDLPKYGHRERNMGGAVIQAVLAGRMDYLDLFRECGLETKTIEKAYRDSFRTKSFVEGPPLTPMERTDLLVWMRECGILRDAFMDSATRLARAESVRAQTLEASATEGWTQNFGHLFEGVKHNLRPDAKRSAAIQSVSGETHIFLFDYKNRHTREFNALGELVRAMPLAEFPNRALAERGHDFVRAKNRFLRPLPWKQNLNK